jgi:ABC-type molybdate transport system ATPase subunit
MAANCAPALIRAISPYGAAHATLRLQLDGPGEGVELLARATRRHLDALGLAPGMAVLAEIRAATILGPSRAGRALQGSKATAAHHHEAP